VYVCVCVCVCVCVQLTADETSILNKLQTVDATPAAAVDTAEGAPALLKKLQSVIVEVCVCVCVCVCLI
jgi:hypothetical protein